MKKSHSGLLFSVIFILILTSCSTLRDRENAIDVNGMVYDFTNRPIPHSEILLGEEIQSITDINGRFTLQRVQPGLHTIIIRKSGFETYAEEIYIRDRAQIIYIRMPSQSQLLELVDDAIARHDFIMASALVERAYNIDPNNIVMLFYYATVAFRLQDYASAIMYLETAQQLGSRDLYISRFLAILRELQSDNQEE